MGKEIWQKKCKHVPFKNNVMDEAMEVFYNDKFKTNNIFS